MNTAFGILVIGSCVVGALVVNWAVARRQRGGAMR